MAQYQIRDFENYKSKQAAKAEARKDWTWSDFHKRDGKELERMKLEAPKLFAKLFYDQFGIYPKNVKK